MRRFQRRSTRGRAGSRHFAGAVPRAWRGRNDDQGRQAPRPAGLEYFRLGVGTRGANHSNLQEPDLSGDRRLDAGAGWGMAKVFSRFGGLIAR